MDWLENVPVVADLYQWILYARPALTIMLILLLSWVALYISRKFIGIFRTYLTHRAIDNEDLKRVETLSRAAYYLSTVIITIVTVMLLLSEIGISIAPILATAGVAGVAIGFGAQSLIKDYFSGFFLLLENQVRQGDVVDAGGKSGLVEEVTLRYLKLRDYEGAVHFVPNGSITTVTNKSRGFAFSVIIIGVAYREDLQQVFTLMRQVAQELRRDQIFGPKIIEDLDIAGVEELEASAVSIKSRFKTQPLEQWSVRREYLLRLKNTFDQNGIEIPFPHLTIYAGQNKDGSAPVFPINIKNNNE